MTAPICLTAPDGTVYAYACAICHRIPATGTFVWRRGAEEIAGTATETKARAEFCCVCPRCKKAIPLGDNASHFFCAACLPIATEEDRVRFAGKAEEARVVEASLAMCLDREAADALRLEMSAISEEYSCAGWLDGLEFILWEMLEGADRAFGNGAVAEEEIASLRALSEKCGGWWTWRDDVSAQTFAPLAEWRAFVAARKGAST